MDKTIAGLLGAVGALALPAAGHAAATAPVATEDALHAASYTDLFKPIPNAAALLKASDAAQAEADVNPALVQEVQYHHHHHHHRYYRRRHHHHHHHRPVIRIIP